MSGTLCLHIRCTELGTQQVLNKSDDKSRLATRSDLGKQTFPVQTPRGPACVPEDRWKGRSEPLRAAFSPVARGGISFSSWSCGDSGVDAAAKWFQSCPTLRPHRRQPTRLPRPWDSPGKNTGVGCHFLLQCMKGKSESEVTQSCLTLSDPMDCSLPGSSIHGIFQARVLEWGAIAFSYIYISHNFLSIHQSVNIYIASMSWLL